jgi:hypothetical protein
MTALRLRNIVAALSNLIGGSRRSRSLQDGPGCTCESCVQAWDRHHPSSHKAVREVRQLRPGIY